MKAVQLAMAHICLPNGPLPRAYKACAGLVSDTAEYPPLQQDCLIQRGHVLSGQDDCWPLRISL